MLELLETLDTGQWIVICLGLILVIISLKDNILGLIKAIKLPSVKIPSKPKNGDGLNLTDLVAKWEALADACYDSDLDDAYEKLQEVFPLLIEVRDE